MGTGRRLAALLLLLGVIGVPAAALRIGCIGDSCPPAAVSAPAPFCSLPTDLRDLVSAGSYEGRSPDVLGVASSTPVVTDVGAGVEVPWPSTAEAEPSAMAVPLAFMGRRIRSGSLPPDVTLDQVAPTLAAILDLQRAHPDVRSGTEIQGVVRPGASTPLAVVVVWKGIGKADLERKLEPFGSLAGSLPSVQSAGGTITKGPGATSPSLRGVGTASGSAMTGSLPLDPTAIEATIGTGGLPSQHGITGADIRNILTGKVVPAFGSAAPQPVIATLGDDLDLATHGATMIGLIGDAPGDQGLTGDDWYGGPASVLDRRANNARDVASFLRDGWGGDGVPDLLAVALSGSAASDRRATDGVVSQVLHAVPDATIIVAGTGSVATHKAMTAPTPAGADSMAAGGVFVDRGAGAVPPQDVVDELKGQTAPDGSPLFADAFASYAVRFGRYC